MKTFLRISSVICLISWMGLIFYFSSQTAGESSAVSGGIIKIMAEKFYPEFQNLSTHQKQEIVAYLQDTVRMLAHYCIYIGLGFFAFLSFISYVNLKFKTRLFYMFSISAVYSLSDEIHQNFVDGRSMQLVDIAVDCLGIITALILCSLFVLMVKPLRRRVKYNDTKKALIELNNSLYEKLDNSLFLQKQLEKEIEKYKTMQKKEEAKVEKRVETVEEKPSEFSEDFEFASFIIGKVVVEATKTCNELSNGCQTADRLELVNLILGRTEVLKSEILKILTSEATLEIKKKLMQDEENCAYDYFNSIKAQIS